MAAERAGTPAVGVMTADFVSAAASMGRALGVPDYDFGVIEHPVSSADDAGLRRRAAVAAATIAQLVVKQEAA